MKMAWIFLLVAGLCEVVWSVALSYSNGLSRLWPSVLTISVMLVSFYLLSLSMKVIPLGTAYAVFTGIGAVGAVIYGILVLGEPRNGLRMAFLAGLILSIIGLRLVSTEKPAAQAKKEEAAPAAFAAQPPPTEPSRVGEGNP
jgi:quaternary ammonium compound-resistance protein SugE